MTTKHFAARRFFPWARLLFGLPLLTLALACEIPAPTTERTVLSSPRQGGKQGGAKEQPTGPPPPITAKLAKVKLNWKDRQQTFELHLTSTGSKLEIVNAVVYARNDATEPPRRGISPPTAFDWFNLAESVDGLLTAADVEQAWKKSGFQSGRGGTLRRTWDVKVPPETTEVVECAHDLNELSPHPKWKDRKLAAVPYTDYDVWLFTKDGRCYFQEQWRATGNPPQLSRVEPKPEAAQLPAGKPAPEGSSTVAAKTKEPRPHSPAAEAQAASELKLAQYYLKQQRDREAEDKLRLIVEKYPDTEAAKTATALLMKLKPS